MLIIGAVFVLSFQYLSHLRRMEKITPGEADAAKPSATPQTIPEMLTEIDAHQDPARFTYANRGRALP